MRIFVVVLALLFFVPLPVQADDASPGASCSEHASGAGQSRNGGIFTCTGGVWVANPLYVGTTSATCDSDHAGLMRYNSGEIEFCDGSSWRFFASGSGSCSAPSGLSFTNVTEQSLNTVVTSNTATITFSGCSSGNSVSVSGGGNPEISINGGTWTSSGVILSGETLRVRMTSSGSSSTTLTATVTVGSTNTNWTVTTRSGALKAFLTTGSYMVGALGGLTGADAVCQAEANSAGYAGSYKAIMCDATTGASTRLTLAYPIVNAYDGSTVASTSGQFWGTQANFIRTKTGGTSIAVVTGCNNAGATYTNGTCSSWTVANGSACAYGTQQSFAPANWLFHGFGSYCACNTSLTIYCIQQ